MPAVSTGHINHFGHCRPLAIFRILLLLLLPLLAVAQALAVTAIPAPTPVLQLGGTGPGHFGEASSVALDSSGNIYVGDLENQRIQEFDSGGNYLGQFAVGMDPVAITIANGIVYIAGNNSSTGQNLREYNLSTAQLSTGFGSGSAFQSVAVDAAGNVYVVESSHGDIQQYSPTGTLLNSSFGGSTGVAIATDANYLYLSTCGQGGLTVGSVQKFNFSGVSAGGWTSSQFFCGVGITVDSAEDIRIADYQSHQVLNFTNSGTLIFQIGSIGQGTGQFYHPRAVAVDGLGRTLVADLGNSRVQILDGSGNFVSAFGHPTLYSYEDETAVTSTPDGHIYVTDTLPDFSAERLSVFDSQGNLTFLRYFADAIQGKYQNLDFPSAVAVAADGSIYVNFSGSLCTSGYSNLIIKFDSNLNPLTAADSPHCPGGMTVNALGLVYGGGYDTDNVYDANLNPTGSFQFIGTNGDTIGTTGSIAVDSQGVIYVTTGSDLGIYTGPSASDQIGFFPLIGQSLAAAPDRTLFVTDFNFNTLSAYPPESTNAQVIWNLPYEPTNVSADRSRVYVVSGTSGGAPNAITVSVYTTPVFISSVTPPTGADTGNVTVTIAGRGFQQGASVALARSGQSSITATSATFTPDGTSATAQFNLAGAADGAWDVVVTNPDGTSATLPGGFQIAPGKLPVLWLRILGRQIVQTGQPTPFTIAYGNAGNVDAPGIAIFVRMPPQARVTTPLPVLTDSNGTDVLLADSTLPPGASRAAPLLLTLSSSATIQASFIAALEPQLPVDPTVVGDLLSSQASNGSYQAELQLSSATGGGDLSLAFSESTTGPFSPLVSTFTQSNGQVDFKQVGDPQQVEFNVETKGDLGGWSDLFKSTYDCFQGFKESEELFSTDQCLRIQYDMNASDANKLDGLQQALNFDEVEACEVAVVSAGATIGGAGPIGAVTGGVGALSFGAIGSLAHKYYCAQLKQALIDDCTVAGNSGLFCSGVVPGSNNQTFGELYGNPNNNDARELCEAVRYSCLHPPFEPPKGGFTPSGQPDTSVALVAGSPIDPNAKAGPPGTGAQNYVSPLQPFPYTIFFTNEATATLRAQKVVVTDQIDTTKFNVSTFTFGPITLPQETITPPPGLQNFAATIDLRPGIDLVVRVNANLNASTGVATWTFSSIAPSTGLPPTDPSVGFLPPDTSPPNGEANVTYSVQPLPGLATGTVVSNTATVVFDQNSPISTNVWTNTVDSLLPVSHVAALPPTETSATFPVSWAGTDATSGIANYSTWVSDNSGPFTTWLANTTDTSDPYPGVAGHTYGFYSIAQDNAGNIEAAKTQAEATTTVRVGGPPTAACQNVTVPTDPNACSAASASINNGSSDPDGDSITFTQTPPGPYALGTTGVKLTVTDTQNLSSTCTGNITVVDKQPPTISSISTSPNMI